jgi:hypothetical protein
MYPPSGGNSFPTEKLTEAKKLIITQDVMRVMSPLAQYFLSEK